MRKFRFRNSLGNEYSLQNNKVLATSPTGLGIERELTFDNIGSSLKLKNDNYTFKEKTFTVNFFGTKMEVYEEYRRFIQFLALKPLTLIYQPPNTFTEYMIEVELVSLDKTEIGMDGVLNCPMILKPISLWKTVNENIVTVSSEDFTESKKYPLTRPYSFGIKSLENVGVYNNGFQDVPFEFEINGRCTNPIISISDANGNRYGKCQLNGTFDRIVINSDDSNESIYLEKDGVELANSYNYQVFNYEKGVDLTFLKMKVGQSYIRFNLGTFDGTCTIRWRNQYVTV